MSAQDALWLTMDRPNNLMVIDGIMLLRGRPDLSAVREVIGRRVIDRFPVFSCRPVRVGMGWAWERDEDFDPRRHVVAHELPQRATLEELEELVARQRAEPLDHEHPLWQVTLVSPVALADGTTGAALISRFHHAMADGVRLTMVMLSLCDSTQGGVLAAVARQGEGMGGLLGMARQALSATADLTRDSVRLMAHSVAEMGRSGTEAVTAGIELAVDVARHPDRLSSVLEGAGVANRITDDVTSVAKLLLRGPSVATVWTGTPGPAKAVVWSAPLSLKEVKDVARHHGASVNDVLLTAITGGIRRYLSEQGDMAVEEIEWLVPVNLLPIQDNLPEDLGNFFSLVMVVLPLYPQDPLRRLAATQVRMQRIKRSDEAMLTFAIQQGISASPGPMSVGLTNFFANKAVGVLTNVPGPRERVTLAGVDVDQVIGFAPCSGDQPMTATIFSYADSVTIGFAVDQALVPAPRLLVDGTTDELRLMVERTEK